MEVSRGVIVSLPHLPHLHLSHFTDNRRQLRLCSRKQIGKRCLRAKAFLPVRPYLPGTLWLSLCGAFLSAFLASRFLHWATPGLAVKFRHHLQKNTLSKKRRALRLAPGVCVCAHTYMHALCYSDNFKWSIRFLGEANHLAEGGRKLSQVG